MDGLHLQQVPPPHPTPGDLPVPPGQSPDPIGDPTEEPPPMGDPDIVDPVPGPNVPPPMVA